MFSGLRVIIRRSRMLVILMTSSSLKQDGDNPSIGMILCKTKNNFKVEYALRDIHKPMGVSEYEVSIMKSLPVNLKGSLPTIEELEAEFSKNKYDQEN